MQTLANISQLESLQKNANQAMDSQMAVFNNEGADLSEDFKQDASEFIRGEQLVYGAVLRELEENSNSRDTVEALGVVA